MILRGTTLRRSPLAWAGIAVLAVLIGLAGWTELTHAASLSSGSDMDAYWNAALRLRHGQTLYAPGVSNASDLYRYAPWFAYAWIPLTYLPKSAVLAGWMVLCLGAAIASVAPLLRHGPAGWATLALLLPFQLEGAAFGNVQPILVLVLLWGVERRSGPLWVALAASLKAAPLVLAVVYAGRREWGRAAVSVGLTAVLVAPMLLFDLGGYSTAIGGGQMSLLTISPYLWVVAVAATLEAMWFLSRTRYAWVAGSVALMVALPRFLLYEIGLVLIGLARRPREKP